MSETFDYEKWLAKQPGRSYDMVRRIQKNWREMYEGRKKGYEVALFVATQFGVRRVTVLFAQGPDIIVVLTVGGGEFGDIIYAPVE